MRLRVHLWVLPRWFALPVALSSIALGGLLEGAGWNLALALLTGALLMAFAHSFNSLSDWLIGFDRGPKDERSRKKLYTGAQNLIAEGKVSLAGAWANSIAWLVAAYLVAAILASRSTGGWVWVPVLWITVCALWYSPAKKAWHPEIPLALGFGPFSVMLGAAASPNPDLWQAFLAGIPLGVMFGGAAELVDQWLDAEVNIGKGLKSLGVWAWGYNTLPELLALEIILAYLALWALVWGNVLSPWAALFSVVAAPFLMYTVAWLTTQTGRAIKAGLLGIFLFGALITLGQWLAG